MSESKSWKEQVAELIAAGAKVRAPNDLPVNCIRHDGLLLECEHGDHQTYLFPVDVKYLGEPDRGEDEFHALIYTDGNIALTLCEAEYHLWHVSAGGMPLNPCLSGSFPR